MWAHKLSGCSSVRLRERLSRPDWLLISVALSLGLLIASIDAWIDIYIGSTLHRRVDVVLIGIVFPLSIVLVTTRLIRVRREAATARADAVSMERRRISRDLHDSVAQQIGYVHFRLDTLIAQDSMASTTAIRQELDQMREVTNEAYDHIYGMLTELRESGVGTLSESLFARAKLVGSRAGFEVALVSHGEPRALLAQSRHQVLYAFREALSNIEKHSGARHVILDLDWQADSLLVCLRDDGCGFTEVDAARPGHYGLDIMRERADQIGGRLVIESVEGNGTTVCLRVPFKGNLETDQSRILNGRKAYAARDKS